MVSAIPVSMWTRWLLVQEDRDLPLVRIAGGAPARWYAGKQPFGISNAPTRFGLVSYSLKPTASGDIQGWVSLQQLPRSTKTNTDMLFHVRLLAATSDGILSKVIVQGKASLVALHADNNTAVISPDSSTSSFNISASFTHKSV